MDFETRDRVAKEYFAKEYSSSVWGHSAGSMKFTFGHQLDGWIYWCQKGLLSISEIKGTGKNWVQPYDFNPENSPNIRKFLIGCSVDFGIELSVSVPKNKARDLVDAYNQGMNSKNQTKAKKSSKKQKSSKKNTKKKAVKKKVTKKAKKRK
jgi:hypothetical protein